MIMLRAASSEPRTTIDMKTKTSCWVFSLGLCWAASVLGAQGPQDLFTEVRVGSASFNPAKEQRVELRYELRRDDAITVGVYDCDGGLVRRLAESAPQSAGAHKVVWDGKDQEGKIVPDEAYAFTLEAASGAVFDAATFSGGVVGDLTAARFDEEAGTVEYQLPQAARVLIRLGLQGGPMLKTLVDWKPRPSGSVTEYWDGRDESKLIAFHKHKDFKVLITYVTFPEATVIAYGNDRETYRDYKLGRGQKRPQKPKRPRDPQAASGFRAEGLVPPGWARAPRVEMAFPELPDGGAALPVVTNSVNIRIDVDRSDKDELLKGQFEIIFFVDNVFFAEAERGYVPYNWNWELQQIPAGEHILTANLSSFAGQVGVASRKVRVVKNTAAPK